jgi:hypothetical protein
MQGTTLLLACAAAVLSLGSVMLGLYFTLTGKDPLPKRVRRVLRRMPASVEDFRLRGMSLTLGGVAVMLMATILTANAVYMLNIGGFTGYAPVATVEFPKDTVFLVTVLAALAAIACFFGSYLLALRVRYVSTRNSTGAQVGMPPA